MSWDAIIAALSTAGEGAAAAGATAAPAAETAATIAPIAEAAAIPSVATAAAPAATAGIASKIGETLLGQVPRTESIPAFTGDTLQGITNPHGLVGQAMRLTGAVGAFSQGVPQGMQYLNALNAADAVERGNLAVSAAQGWTPGEYQTRFGQPVPPGTQTSLQARDMSISQNPTDPQASPSAPNRVAAIQFPNTPEELTAARDAELMQRRSMPNFGQGASRQEATQQAELAQRKKLPLGASEKTVLTQNAIAELPEDTQFRAQYSASDEGQSAQFAELPPENMSMDMETYDKVGVPNGFVKSSIPDQKNPGRVYMKIRNAAGDNIWDVARAAANGDQTAQEMLNRVYPNRSGIRSGKVGSPDTVIEQIQTRIQRDLSPDELSEFLSSYGQGAKDLKPGESQKKLQDFLVKVGYMENPIETQAQDKLGQLATEIANDYRQEKQTQQQPSGPSTPSYPNAQGTPGRPAMTPGGIVEQAAPNAPPVVPKPLAAPKNVKKRGFNELQPDDLSTASSAVLEALAKSGPDAAVQKLASIVNKFTLSEAEKEMLAFSVIQGLRLPASAKLELHNKAQVEIE